MGVVLLAPAGVLVLLSKPLVAEGTWGDIVFDLFGWLFFAAGSAIRIWSTLYVGARKRTTLVSDRPYSICRNPLYVGTFLLAISGGLFFKSLTFSGAVGLLVLGYMWVTIPAEEKGLRETLGQPYEEYFRRVRRFWPHLSLFQTPEIVEVKIKGLRMEAKRMLVWIWLPYIGELIAHLRVETWWPHLLRFP